MKIVKLVGSIGLVLILFAGIGYFMATEKDEGSKDFGGPKIVVEPATWDFGEVRQPAIVSHDFTVKNTGDQTLEIKRVSTSCGCTSAEINKEKIEPGQQAILTVKYDSIAMAHEKGRLERTVFIKNNDLERPQVEVIIKVYVF